MPFYRDQLNPSANDLHADSLTLLYPCPRQSPFVRDADPTPHMKLLALISLRDARDNGLNLLPRIQRIRSYKNPAPARLGTTTLG